jgi:hypothetical protein
VIREVLRPQDYRGTNCRAKIYYYSNPGCIFRPAMSGSSGENALVLLYKKRYRYKISPVIDIPIARSSK